MPRYANPDKGRQYRAELSALFAYARAAHPRVLTHATVNRWVADHRDVKALRSFKQR